MENEEKEKKMKFKVSSLIITILVIAILAVGGVVIYQALSSPKNDIEEKEERKEEPVKEEKKVKIVDINSKTRPYGIMINCHNEALPQAGLQDAYIIYEALTRADEAKSNGYNRTRLNEPFITFKILAIKFFESEHST